MKLKNPTQSYFNATAGDFVSRYDHSPAFQERYEICRAAIQRYAVVSQPEPVCLDLGCGDGRYGRIAAHQGFQVVGVDQSEEMLGLARTHASGEGLGPRASYVQASLPLPEPILESYRGRVNLLLCFSALEYVEEDQKALEQFSELLSESGVLLLTLPNRQSYFRMLERAVIHSGLLALFPGSYLKYQRRQFDLETTRRSLRRLGLQPLEDRFFALPFQRITGRILGAYRGRRVATLFLIAARKQGVSSDGRAVDANTGGLS